MTRFSILLALIHLTALNLAFPNPPRNPARQFSAAITFIGAGPDPASYFQLFPTDDTLHAINNTLSVSQITSPGGAICSFFGADGSDTFLAGGETVDVGPPQVQVSGVCDVE